MHRCGILTGGYFNCFSCVFVLCASWLWVVVAQSCQDSYDSETYRHEDRYYNLSDYGNKYAYHEQNPNSNDNAYHEYQYYDKFPNQNTVSRTEYNPCATEKIFAAMSFLGAICFFLAAVNMCDFGLNRLDAIVTAHVAMASTETAPIVAVLMNENGGNSSKDAESTYNTFQESGKTTVV